MATHPGGPGMGLPYLRCKVEQILSEDNYAVVRDEFGKTHSIPLYLRAKGQLPVEGEVWLISRDLGTWTFALCIEPIPLAVTGSNDGIPALVSLLNIFESQNLIVDNTNEGFTGVNLPYRAAQDPIAVTSGSFVSTWESSLGFFTLPALRWSSVFGVDPSTTGEAKLSIGGGDSGVYALSAATLARHTWNWIRSIDLGVHGDGVLIQLKVRRTSGSGTIYSYAPDVVGLAPIDEIGATVDGL